MSPTKAKKTSPDGYLRAVALFVALAMGCFDDRSLGVIDDGGPGGGGTPGESCGIRTSATFCQTSSICRWLEPGCGTPPLPRAACAAVAELNCQGDGDCPAGKKCLTYSVNPCAGPTAPGQATCGACGSQDRICW